MSITAERKQALINEHATKKGDTGSPEVQIAVLSERISNLTEHFNVLSLKVFNMVQFLQREETIVTLTNQ